MHGLTFAQSALGERDLAQGDARLAEIETGVGQTQVSFAILWIALQGSFEIGFRRLRLVEIV